MKFFIEKVNDKNQFTASFERLLLPVKQSVLSEFIDDLKSEYLQKALTEDFTDFCDLSKKYINDKVKEKAPHLPWVKSVIFLSLQMISKNLERPFIWTRVFGEFITIKVIEANWVVIDEFAQLYKLWKTYLKDEDGFAQPYAFYLLFAVAIGDERVRANIKLRGEDDDLNNYLHCVETGKSHISNDRLIDFAKDFYKNGNKLLENSKNQSDYAARSLFERVNLKEVDIKLLLSGDRPLNITAIGIPGSGKSTIIKMARYVLAAPADKRLEMSSAALPITSLNIIKDAGDTNQENTNFFGPLGKRTQTSNIPISEFTGEMKIGGLQYPLSFYDVRGGQLVATPPKYTVNYVNPNHDFETKLTQTDLLLVVLDPETIFYEEGSSIFSFVDILHFITARLDFLFDKSSHPMVALVFAKFDEYGSVIRGPKAMISNESQINNLIAFMENDSDENWNILVSSIAQNYKDNNEETPLSSTVKLLLERIKHLLRVILNSKKHPVVNCYIASSAIMQEVRKSLWTGYPEAFNDFAHYMAWLIKKKQGLKTSPLHVQTSVDEDGVNVSFYNPGDKELLAIVERQFEDDSFRVIGSAVNVPPQSTGNYFDKQVNYNQTYSYQVRFIDNSTDQNSSRASETVTATIPGPPSNPVYPPVDIQETIVKDNVKLEWNNINTIPVGIRLERKDNNNDFKVVFKDEDVTQASDYLDTDTEKGKIYHYRLLSFETDEQANESTYTQVREVRTPPYAVKTIKCEPKPNKDYIEYVSLTWEEATNNSYAVSYRITRSTVNDKGGIIATEQFPLVEGNFYNDQKISRGLTYSYEIVTFEPVQERMSRPVLSETIKVGKPNRAAIIVIIVCIVLVIICIVWLWSLR